MRRGGMTNLTRDERLELADALREAQGLLDEVIEVVGMVVRATGDEGARRTVLANLQILRGGDHGWLSRDRSLDDMIRALEEVEPEDDEL